MVIYDRAQQRIYFLNRRIHHGLAGACVTLAGVALMAHDWRDHDEWLRALFVSAAMANNRGQMGHVKFDQVHGHGNVIGSE